MTSAPRPLPLEAEASSARRYRGGFTLIEVMIAIAVLGISLIALLALHHQDLQSVIRTQQITTAAMLAQGLMTQAEMERFPRLGTTSGDFQSHPHFHWKRTVRDSGIFPTVREVQITINYGPGLRSHFDLAELLHDPVPPFGARVMEPPESIHPPPAPPAWSMQ